MLPVTHGVDFTKQQILIYAIMLLAVSLLPFVIQMSGLLYLAGALFLGCAFVYHAMKLLRCEGRDHATTGRAMDIATVFSPKTKSG
jgi:protoheme IX farnesyltransferase